ncbi:MAG: hypothetical protein MUO77_06725, partial [Anaerolineales bacterium]|nr:hypothetical protein [Anaerolineales bacterium]
QKLADEASSQHRTASQLFACDISKLTYILIDQEQGRIMFIDDRDMRSNCILLHVISVFPQK